jgi:hypothetical protein
MPTTGKVFSLHHSATISYYFDKIFTPNAFEMTLLSQLFGKEKLSDYYEIWTDDQEMIGHCIQRLTWK